MIRPSSSLGRLSNLKVFEYRRCLMLSTTLHHIKSLLTIGTHVPMCELSDTEASEQGNEKLDLSIWRYFLPAVTYNYF